MMNQKILIIDDDSQDRKGIMIALEKEGYGELLCAATAQEGLDLARGHNPGVIFIDVVLDKGIDGFDICVQLRQEGNKAKIIMVTGHLDAVNAKKARVSGADEIVEKTAGFKNLGATIKRISPA